jgi:hypothetical protein
LKLAVISTFSQADLRMVRQLQPELTLEAFLADAGELYWPVLAN